MGQQFGAAIPPQWWDRLKGAQFGFIAGLAIGLIFGWFFHGVISLAIRFGLLVMLLLPLIVIGWLWFRSQRRTPQRPARNSRETGATWTAVIDVGQPPVPVRRDRADPTLVDVPLIRPQVESNPDEIEAELEFLKRQRDRGA
ncbi:MAG: hypothetical protein H0U31_00880 [Chloroflexia bacterium]|nr:hypothetical protein [Chloroflexia bacterium]